MKYTVDEINSNRALLPGIRLGYEIFDTCFQSATLVKATMYLLSDKDTGELAVSCNYTDYQPRVAAIIGPYTSEMVSVVGNLLVCLAVSWNRKLRTVTNYFVVRSVKFKMLSSYLKTWWQDL